VIAVIKASSTAIKTVRARPAKTSTVQNGAHRQQGQHNRPQKIRGRRWSHRRRRVPQSDSSPGNRSAPAATISNFNQKNKTLQVLVRDNNVDKHSGS
jgi:hypothetical protein